jgi:hypothetical protein
MIGHIRNWLSNWRFWIASIDSILGQEEESMPQRTAFLALATVFILMTACVLNPEAAQVNQYRGDVELLMGKGPEELIPLVTDTWRFEFFSNWAKMNPTPEIAFKLTRRSAPISKREARKVFKDSGYYDVVIYYKKCREGSARLWDGEPELYLTYHEHPVEYTHYIVLRLVFRDKKLHDCRFFHLNVGRNEVDLLVNDGCHDLS